MDCTEDVLVESGGTGERCVSMHEGTETWDDLCICEPEPRWAEVADELGMT